MKLAIISDIHGNSYALDQVLAKIDALGIEQIVCLGDIALSGFDPNGSIDRLIERGIPTVRGNTDGRILANDPYQPDDPAEAARERDWMDWTLKQIGQQQRAFLDRLPGTIDIELAGWRITAYHGSPQNYYDPVLPGTLPEMLAQWFEGTEAEILLGGHTHQQMLRRWNGRSIVNPGPISLNPEKLPAGDRHGRPWAEFAVLSLEAGSFDLSFQYVPINLDHLDQRARASGMPHIEAWLEQWTLDA